MVNNLFKKCKFNLKVEKKCGKLKWIGDKNNKYTHKVKQKLV